MRRILLALVSATAAFQILLPGDHGEARASLRPPASTPRQHRLPTNPHVVVFYAATTATALNGPGGSVSIRADGTTRVRGIDSRDRLVKVHLSRSYVLYLLREFEVAGFFSLPPDISGTGIIADAPQQVLTVQTRGGVDTVTETAVLTPAPEARVFNFLSLLVSQAAGLHVYP